MTELTRLRDAAGDHAEVVTLLLRSADAEDNTEAATALRHRAAEVAADKLGDRERAVTLEQLRRADAVYVGNSARGLLRAELV